MASLAELNVDDLAEALVSIAQEVRKLLVEGDVAKIHAHLARVRESANDASGERLALLEVAEGFLRAMARSDLGRNELALHRLFAEHFEVAEGLFTRLLKPGTVAEGDFAGMGADARRLVDDIIELGVLQREGNVYGLRPSMRALARELLEPAALRMWRRVHEARGQIGLARLPDDRAAECLSGQLGITQAQARAHLAAYRLQANREKVRWAQTARKPATHVVRIEGRGIHQTRKARGRNSDGDGLHNALILRPTGSKPPLDASDQTCKQAPWQLLFFMCLICLSSRDRFSTSKGSS